MQYGLQRYSLIDGSASSRVQGTLSHLPPRNAWRISARQNDSSLGRYSWNRMRSQTTHHYRQNSPTIFFGAPTKSLPSYSGKGQPAKGLLPCRMRAASRLQTGLGTLRQEIHIDGVDLGARESGAIVHLLKRACRSCKARCGSGDRFNLINHTDRTPDADQFACVVRRSTLCILRPNFFANCREAVSHVSRTTSPTRRCR
jgi:hypothetical protein